jgi:hypothetical protein
LALDTFRGPCEYTNLNLLGKHLAAILISCVG